MKRFSSNYLFIPQVGFVKQCVAEMDDRGIVIRLFPLINESASTSWLPGLLVLSEENDTLSPIEMIQTTLKKTLTFDQLPSTLIDDISSFQFILYQLYPFDLERMFPREETKVFVLS